MILIVDLNNEDSLMADVRNKDVLVDDLHNEDYLFSISAIISVSHSTFPGATKYCWSHYTFKEPLNIVWATKHSRSH